MSGAIDLARLDIHRSIEIINAKHQNDLSKTSGQRLVNLEELNMVVGETLELFVVFAMVIISLIIVMLIQKATGGIDEE
jgi:hypothetical protein